MVHVYFPLTLAVVPNVTARVNPSGPVTVGATVELVCEAIAGDTPISFFWTDDSNSTVSPSDADGNVSLTLSSAGDYGRYTCTASSIIGSTIVHLDVNQPGKICKEFSMYHLT